MGTKHRRNINTSDFYQHALSLGGGIEELLWIKERLGFAWTEDFNRHLEQQKAFFYLGFAGCSPYYQKRLKRFFNWIDKIIDTPQNV